MAHLNRVSIAGVGSFLPNEPVPNERIDEVLGPLDQAPADVQKFVNHIIPRMLKSNGINFRHFAIDPTTRRITHCVSDLGEVAARRAMEDAGIDGGDLDLLLLSCSMYDQSTPPTSTILQERLGVNGCAEMEIHSNCAGVGKMMQVAFDALRLGRYRTALIVYPQLSSVYLRSSYFNQPVITKSQAALRYILADGAGAVVLRAAEPGEEVDHEVLGTYVESVGMDRPPGMTAGAGVCDLLENENPIRRMFEQGDHHLDQDFAAVARDSTDVLALGVKRMLAVLNLSSSDIHHYVYSIPGTQLYDANIAKVTGPFGVTEEQVKFRAQDTGYCGGAAILLHLDRMVKSQELRPGQLVVLHSVESSKWMSAGFVARW